MNKKEIREKLLTEKKAKLIDTLEINSKTYAKTLISSKLHPLGIAYRYYQITETAIYDINNNELEFIKQNFETDDKNVVY